MNLVCVVVDCLAGKVPDAEWNTLIIVLDHPRRYVDAVGDVLTEAAAADRFAFCQRAHQTEPTESHMDIGRFH